MTLPYENDFLNNLCIDPATLLMTLDGLSYWFFPTSYVNHTKRAQMYISDAVSQAGNPKLKPGSAYYNVHATVPWDKLPGAVTKIRTALNATHHCNFDFLSLLKYADSTIGIAPHKDQQDEGDWNYPIATVSLGVTRRFWYASDSAYSNEIKNLRMQFEKEEYAKSTAKTKAKEQAPEQCGTRLTPASGSLLIMPAGFQKDFMHAILKDKEQTGLRISLTFRVLPKGGK